MISLTQSLLDTTVFGSVNLEMILMAVLFLFLLLVIVLLITQIVKVGKLKKRLDQFTSGSDGKSLEEDIIEILENNNLLIQNAEKNQNDIKTLNRKMETAYQKLGIVKYDAFHQMGGQLSFSLCLLNQQDDGFIINSVHSTEGCYSYTKKIKAGESDVPLGDEEQEALTIAMESGR